MLGGVLRGLRGNHNLNRPQAAEKKRAGAGVHNFRAFHVMGDTMSDLLKRSALAYKELMPYRYHFTLGRKGQLRHLSIHFPEVAYHHLAGFHRAGMAALSNKKKSLETVLAGAVTYEHFKRAGAVLEDRWTGICRLKEIIESNRVVFYYRGHEQPGSMLEGDYLMVHDGVAFFIAGGVPESIFEQTSRRYEQGCPRFVTLQISREEMATSIVTCLFRSATFIEKNVKSH